MKGIGIAGEAVGKFIGRIPFVERGQVDEFLQELGEQLQLNAEGMEDKTVASFAEVKDPSTVIFINKLDDMINIYNHTTQIVCDKDNVYLIS